MNSTVKTVLIVAGVAAAGYIAYTIWKKNQPQQQQATTTGTATQAPTGNGISDIINSSGNVLDSLGNIFG